MTRIELLEHHGLDAPRAERPRGRGAEQAGPDDRDLDLLHAATIAGAGRPGRADRGWCPGCRQTGCGDPGPSRPCGRVLKG